MIALPDFAQVAVPYAAIRWVTNLQPPLSHGPTLRCRSRRRGGAMQNGFSILGAPPRSTAAPCSTPRMAAGAAMGHLKSAPDCAL
jgi:hypothetical protein